MRSWVAVSKASVYPSGNTFVDSYAAVKFVGYGSGNYTLSNDSPFAKAGTDNRDLGADVAAVTAATAGAVVQ